MDRRSMKLFRNKGAKCGKAREGRNSSRARVS